MERSRSELKSSEQLKPDCVPWQNKVFAYKGKSKKYPDFLKETGYGTAGGLKGVNCTHDFYPFWEGISVIPEDIKERPPVTVNGKTYDSYQATQKQRSMERDIRATKREIEAQKAIGGDTTQLNAKLRRKQADYRSFSEKADLKVKANRTRVVGGSGTKNAVRSKGLAAANHSSNEVQKHENPILLKKIDYNDKKAIMSEFARFEKDALNSDIEKACVITRNGEVYICFGTKDQVFPDYDLGDKILGASISHNHPSDVTEYSFSDNDFGLFIERKLDVLRGSDVKYKYEFNRYYNDIDEHKSIFDLTDEDGAHENSISNAEKSNVGYRRWKNE